MICSETSEAGFKLFNKAIQFAVKAHDGQYRKGSHVPYIVHPMEVAALAAAMTADGETIAAAVLHDTLEDTGVTREMLREEFGETVAYLVANESENKRRNLPKSETWKIRKQETIDHLANCTDIRIKIIALADKLANLRAVQRDYAVLGDELWTRFNQKDPRELRWYYASFLDTCADLKDTEIYNEFRHLVDMVF